MSSTDAQHQRGALAKGIPLSSKIVIITATAVLFGLGVIYLEQQRKVVASYYQVMGVRELPRGVPAAFRVIQYDDRHMELVPVLVESAALRSGDRTFPGRPGAATPMVDAAVQFDAVDLPLGPATLEVSVAPWEGEPRTLEIPVEVIPRGDATPTFPFNEPQMPNEDFARIETVPVGDVILGERVNSFWIRVSDDEDRALDAQVEVLMDGVRVSEQQLGPLGLGLGTVQLTKPNHELGVIASITGTEGTMTKGLAPMGLIRIRPVPSVIRDPATERVTLEIESETVAERLHCGLWRGDALMSLFAVPTERGRASHELAVSGEGLHRITCTDHPKSEWWGDSFFLVSADPAAVLDRYRDAMAEERFFSSWPPSSELTPVQLEMALGYLLERAVRTPLPYASLLKTLEADQQELAEEGRTQRFTLLALIAAVGLSLLLWAVAMVLHQRRSLDPTRLDPEFLDEMDGDLGDEGLGRKGMLLPAACLISAALVNVAALIYILLMFLN